MLSLRYGSFWEHLVGEAYALGMGETRTVWVLGPATPLRAAVWVDGDLDKAASCALLARAGTLDGPRGFRSAT